MCPGLKELTRDGGIAGIHNYMNLSPPGPNRVRQELGQKLLQREYLYSDSFLCNELWLDGILEWQLIVERINQS